MLKIIENWLEKPSERYSDGISIFEQLATPDIKKRYIDFFKEVKGNPKTHDIHFTMLISKVSAIYNKVKINPTQFNNVKLFFKETDITAETVELIAIKNEKIEILKAKLQEIKSENSDIILENEELTEDVETLESDLEDANVEISDLESQIETLETEIETLKAKRGIQIVSLKDLPEDILKKYNANREMTPIMANLHAQISVEGIPVKERAKLVKKLYTYDDLRRANWDAINEWSEGKDVSAEVVVEVPAYSPEPLIAGVQIARRIERLKENIARSVSVLETTDKETIKANAEKRIANYNAELAELEAKVADVK